MHAETINEKRHEFEEECGKVYRDERERDKSYNYIIILKRKQKIKLVLKIIYAYNLL